ncbi:M56 family metallopeptidase [Arthrobacter sp. A2-55]|uniref:M56 family metallopeptidase n=1 Tax=Arthrobacter sp. A2-55 TaxID=2897337 RepID=UPI0021CD8CDB|nr:M48 family metalloprotease [Arthrobacter sp. A2-55]MCU6481804.1 M48 family metalloprotease [Arthrobacter sp. A2-55]
MTVALVLFGYAVALAVFAGPLLRRARWVDRAPRLAIALWHALSVTVLASAAMAGLALTVPTVQVSGDLAALLRACVMALREQYASPGGAAAGATGAVLALAILARTLWCLARAALRAARDRARHRQVLDIVGRPDRGHGFTILDCAESAAYCLPGRQRRTVVTTAALQALDGGQLAAVLAHERAHLAERHDLALTFSAAIATAFPAVKLFRDAAAETARLVELRADDVATDRTDRLTVAGALLAVASHGTPAVPVGAMAAGGAGAAARVRRLIPPRRPLGRAQATAGSLAVAVLLALPVLVLGGPAATASQHNLCPDASVSASAPMQ